ncbi:MAG: NUDIX hydrolase [Clostridia bacterium]|nr:NUDIX hydrolase [Clostridia bacterium]
MVFEEKTLDSKLIYDGAVVKLYKETVTVEGGTATREIIKHGGAAVIIAQREDGKIAIERQFRKPANKVILELPAGKIDPGEEPIDCAYRELREETGIRAENMEFLMKFYPALGYSSEMLYMYHATDLSMGARDLDDDESIDLEFYSLDELMEMINEGKIEDSKTLIGILWMKNNA